MADISKISIPVKGQLPREYNLKDKKCREDLQGLKTLATSITTDVVDEVTSLEAPESE